MHAGSTAIGTMVTASRVAAHSWWQSLTPPQPARLFLSTSYEKLLLPGEGTWVTSHTKATQKRCSGAALRACAPAGNVSHVGSHGSSRAGEPPATPRPRSLLVAGHVAPRCSVFMPNPAGPLVTEAQADPRPGHAHRRGLKGFT